MKKQYNEPQIYVENVVVESGIATSMTYIIESAPEVTGDENGGWEF